MILFWSKRKMESVYKIKPRAEEKLKELMGSDKSVIYLIDFENNSLLHFKPN